MNGQTGRQNDLHPNIDYLARDFTSFRQLILDQMSVRVPDWTEESSTDLGNVLVDLLAYVADYLSYYQDAVATEAYLGTARLRRSIRRHARLLDYFLHDGCNARVWVQVDIGRDRVTSTPHLQKRPILLPVRTELLTAVPGITAPVLNKEQHATARQRGALVFETLHPIQLFAAHSEMTFHVHDRREDTLLPAGRTFATIEDRDRRLHTLDKGQVVVFEEVRDPVTGNVDTANLDRRHVVRLTQAIKGYAYNRNGSLVQNPDCVAIAWAEADALPRPFFIGRHGANEEPVTVARGNVVLADQGRRIQGERLPQVLADNRYRPMLQQLNLTHHTPYDHEVALTRSAAESLRQDPRHAVPQIRLCQLDPAIDKECPRQWLRQKDLLSSDRFAPHYVVEMEEDSRAFLRFGFGAMALRPQPGDQFSVDYRVGNGPMGNVGPETIKHLFLPDAQVDPDAGDMETDPNDLGNAFRQALARENLTIARVRNPMSARYGAAPERIQEARLYAPEAFKRQERCVTEQDYADVAARYPGVLQTAARIRWTGVWHTAFVYVRRENNLPLNRDFLERLARHMEPYRHMGYEVEFRDPYPVGLRIKLVVYLAPGNRKQVVKAALMPVIDAQEHLDGSRGFFHPANFGFAEPVFRSKLVAAVMGVPGVERVEVLEFCRVDRCPDNVDVINIERLEIAELRNDSTEPERGTIEVELIEAYEQRR